jgi:endogenous inhibitor of DNA gyrase (YacG/DUF329 family)
MPNTGANERGKRCVICGAALAQAGPFCSDRCRQIDLGRWLDGSYFAVVERASWDHDAERINRDRS